MDYTATGTAFLQQVQKQIKEEGAGWTAGHTYLLDLSAHELASIFDLDGMALSPAEIAEDDKSATSAPDIQIPSKHDWRAVLVGGKTWNYVSPVKNQKNCGSCGAFSAMAAIEGRLRVANRAPGSPNSSIMPTLSEANAYFCHGKECSGIHVRDVFKNIKGGVVTEEDMPYSSVVPGKCNSSKKKQLDCFPQCGAKIGTKDCLIRVSQGTPQAHYTKLASNTWFPRNADELKKALYLYGPLAITYQAAKSFIVYTGGIYRPLQGEPRFGNHAVCLVGYDDDGKCFILKNSWGPGWGKNGFCQIPYEDVELYVTRNDMPMTFAQVYTSKGILYNDLLIRDNLNDYGQAVVEGAVNKSPDIVPCGETPLKNPANTLEDSWFSDTGKNINSGANYIYIRGNSLSPKINIPFQTYLYFCTSSLLMYPNQWKNNLIRTASNKEYASGVAERYGALAIPDEPFLWQPAQLPSGEHYCLIGRMVTPDHPNPVPEVSRIDDFAKFIASNPAYAWRNVSLVDKDVFDHSEILYYEQGTLEGETYFLMEPDEDAPIGATCSLSCAAPGLNFQTSGTVIAPNTAIGALVAIPAGTQANIVFGYNKNTFKGGSSWSIRIRAIYVLPENSDLVDSHPGHVLSLMPECSGSDKTVTPRKGMLVGEYIIQGEG